MSAAIPDHAALPVEVIRAKLARDKAVHIAWLKYPGACVGGVALSEGWLDRRCFPSIPDSKFDLTRKHPSTRGKP